MPKQSLSAAFCAAVTCPEGKAKETYWDTITTGFVLEVRCSGGKTYYLRYLDEYGRQKQLKLAGYADVTFDQARKAAQRLRSEVVLGGNPAAKKAEKRAVPTMEQLSKRYMAHVRSYKRSSHIDESALRKHILPRVGRLRLDEVKQSDVVEWLAAKVKVDGYAIATVNRFQITLGYMFKLAKRWNLPGAEVNPLSGVPLPNPNNNRERFLSPEEAQRLQKVLESSDIPQLKNIVALLLLTGCRKRELLDAQWEEFNLEKRMWRVPMAKSGKARYVPLSADAIQVLRSLQRFPQCPYVLPNPKTGKPFTNLFASWKIVREEAGMPDLRLHDLRHSAASNMVNSGQSLYVVGQVLGHTQPRTTQRYAHLAPDTLLAAVDAGSEFLGIAWTELKSGQD